MDSHRSSFERGAEHVEIRRQKTADGVWLIVSGDGALRSYPFLDLASLLLFQSDIEAWLLHRAGRSQRLKGNEGTLVTRVCWRDAKS
jgi:hypothetical protein